MNPALHPLDPREAERIIAEREASETRALREMHAEETAASLLRNARAILDGIITSREDTDCFFTLTRMQLENMSGKLTAALALMAERDAAIATALHHARLALTLSHNLTATEATVAEPRTLDTDPHEDR